MTGGNNASFFLAYRVPTLTASFFTDLSRSALPVWFLWFMSLLSSIKIYSFHQQQLQPKNCQHPILCACVGEAVGEYFKAFKLEIYNFVGKKKGTMEAGWEPGCLCFCFWLLLTWVVDKVTALIFKQFEMQFDPLVIIKMQELEIHMPSPSLIYYHSLSCHGLSSPDNAHWRTRNQNCGYIF